MVVTNEMFDNLEPPDPFANPDTGAMSTLAYNALTFAQKNEITGLLARRSQGKTLRGDEALLSKYAPYFPAMVRLMADVDVLKLVLDACRP
jgi:hypothetical protein